MAWPERIRVVRGRQPIRGGYLPPEAEDGLPRPAEMPVPTPNGDPGAAKIKAPSDKPPTAEEAIQAAEAAARRAEAGTGMDAVVITIDMMEMVKNGDMSANVLLKSGDIIYVPANPLAEVGLAIQQVLFPILPAATAVTTPIGAASMMRGGQ
jgi:hypothetical protein